MAEGSPGGVSGSGLRTPLGCPVVPDEYSISLPSASSATGPAGWAAIASS